MKNNHPEIIAKLNSQSDLLRGNEVTEQSNSPSLISQLNPQQVEAVLKEEGPYLVLAGAGSGKTKVLTNRVIHLIKERNANPSNIMAVTFTNKASKEMKNRIEQMISKESLGHIWIGTFHGLCNRLLRQEIEKIDLNGNGSQKWSRNFVILDSGESLSVVKESVAALNLDDKIYIPKAIQAQISNFKNQSLTSVEYSRQAKDNRELRISEIYDKYQEKLCLSNAVDFDDLLLLTLKLLQGNPEVRAYYHKRFAHILVDEFQDTNQTQYDLLKMLLINPLTQGQEQIRDWTGRSFCAVGDIDQSIYSWRGANYKLALNFQKDFPEAAVIKLEYNYRSNDPILELANSVIKNNSQRIDKVLIGTKGKGDKVTCFEAADEMEEGYYIASEVSRIRSITNNLNHIAVLYRTNAQSRAIEESLIKHQIPYQIVGGMRFYDRLEIKDLVAYLRLIYNPKDAQALKRVINTPRRGIGPTTVAQIEEKANLIGMSLYAALADLVDSGTLGPKVTQAAHGFVNLIDSLIKQAENIGVQEAESKASFSVPELLKAVIDRTGYLAALKESDKEEAENRIENIYELMNVAQQFNEESDDKTLGGFLSQLALVSELAEMKESGGEAVTLLTIHSSKGLEFPYVFIAGLEEGIFPHTRALNALSNSSDELEEERRLLYVAITRAEKKLHLTFARRRRLWGNREYAEPSRFLSEMAQEQLVGYWGSSVASSGKSTASASAIKSGFGSGTGSFRISSNDRSTQSSFGSRPTTSKPNQPQQPEAPKPDKFKLGDNVKHKNFGAGKVIGTFGSKAQKFYSIEFEGGQGKKLLSGDSLTET
jgi:DNA helicase-2/ATP-dependent DNA helicase PcrA